MSAELVAILCLFAFLILVIFIAVRVLRRKEQSWLGLIASLKLELEAKVHQGLQDAIDAFSGSFQEILGQPVIKKAFGIIGSQGGEAKGQNSLVNEMAIDFLNSSQFSMYKAGADILGLDIEAYIEKHGAMQTIQAIQQFAKVAGIDLLKIDLGSLALPGKQGSGGNPYLRR